ncbi:MAG: lactate racemase domain-containing protein, partial [Bacillota bacterium]|nr:lactate racemase domain-containing protein [Bacillota bacterium]
MTPADVFLKATTPEGLADAAIEAALVQSLSGLALKKVLIVPPDFTRFHSNAGSITNRYYHLLVDRGVIVDILPALGTHVAMTSSECAEMYGDIPFAKFLYHNWRTDVVPVGTVPADYVAAITEGLWTEPVDLEVNRLLMDESYDLILSVGQVVPHEVIGMANHAKNLFVGCGGKRTINQSHMIGAV